MNEQLTINIPDQIVAFAALDHFLIQVNCRYSELTDYCPSQLLNRTYPRRS